MAGGGGRDVMGGFIAKYSCMHHNVLACKRIRVGGYQIMESQGLQV